MSTSTRPNLQRFVDRLERRSVLTDTERDAILGLPYNAEQIQTNRDFVRLDDTISHACFVVAGFVGRFDQDIEGSRQITAIYLPGDMPDLHSVVQPRATSALQALSVSTVLHVPHASIRAIAALHPGIAEALWRDTVADAAISSQWIVNVGRRAAKSRVAHLVCELAFRICGRPAAATFAFALEMTQMHLADATGLTPVHVSRVLRMLREDNLADVQRGRVEVRDWNGLAEAGGFNSKYLQPDREERLRFAPRA